MGGCQSPQQTQTAKEQQEKTKQINKDIEQEKKKADNELKLLLLGAGESGKTTISKQMKILHLDGFPKEERLSYKSLIYSNVITSIRALITAAKEMGIALTQENSVTADKLVNLQEYFSDNLNAETAGMIKAVWSDPGIQEAYARQAEFQLNDSTKYYIEEIDRLATADYIPSEVDVVRCRAKTTGIIETEFDLDGVRFRVVDVGGQRSERKKWMHCFQDVDCVVFCVAMSEYDLKLYEDDSTNRMTESIKLFKEICNNRWFVDSTIVLFLNKKDVFEEKIKKTDLNVCFPDYTGGKNYEAAAAFLQNQFTSEIAATKKQIFPFFTVATESGNISEVFGELKNLLITRKKEREEAAPM